MLYFLKDEEKKKEKETGENVEAFLMFKKEKDGKEKQCFTSVVSVRLIGPSFWLVNYDSIRDKTKWPNFMPLDFFFFLSFFFFIFGDEVEAM